MGGRRAARSAPAVHVTALISCSWSSRAGVYGVWLPLQLWASVGGSGRDGLAVGSAEPLLRWPPFVCVSCQPSMVLLPSSSHLAVSARGRWRPIAGGS